MLSDVLFDAVEQIEEWQRLAPEWYDGLKNEIDAVKSAMNALRERLDDPRSPLETYFAPGTAAREEAWRLFKAKNDERGWPR